LLPLHELRVDERVQLGIVRLRSDTIVGAPKR